MTVNLYVRRNSSILDSRLDHFVKIYHFQHFVDISDNMARDLFTNLVYAREIPGIGILAYYLLKLLGLEIPMTVEIGDNFEIAHGGFGVVIHPWTTIGNCVKIYPCVTVGRADIYIAIEHSHFEGVFIDDDVILSSGAKVLGKHSKLHVGKGTVIGANAVLLESTGENEIWAGVPARLIGMRNV